MRKVVLANYKGGVAKTVTATNMAYILAAAHGKRVLLVDADPQGNSSYFYRGGGDTLYDVLSDRCAFGDAVRCTMYNNLSLLPADMALETLACNMDRLAVELMAVEDEYDYCIIDCQPSLQMNTLVALYAADDLIIPVKIDRNTLNGLELMREKADEMNRLTGGCNLAGCLITMYQHTKACDFGINELLNKYDYPLFDSVIRKSALIDLMTFRRKPLPKFRSKASVTEDYEDFVREYLMKVGDLDGAETE